MTWRLKFARLALEHLQHLQPLRVGQRIIRMLTEARDDGAQRVNVVLELLTVGQSHVRRPRSRANGLSSSYSTASSRPIRKAYSSRTTTSSEAVSPS